MFVFYGSRMRPFHLFVFSRFLLLLFQREIGKSRNPESEIEKLRNREIGKSRNREIEKSGNQWNREIEKSGNRKIEKSRKLKREIEKSKKLKQENTKAKTRNEFLDFAFSLSRIPYFPISRFLDFPISKFFDFSFSRLRVGKVRGENAKTRKGEMAASSHHSIYLNQCGLLCLVLLSSGIK